MAARPAFQLIRRKYEETFGARPRPGFANYLLDRRGAVLGYRRAGSDQLFIEQYVDEAIEALVSRELGRAVMRVEIVELGNFASDNALAMIELWGAAANDLAGVSEVAVATLTAPLRRMFARIGLPIAVLAPARPERLTGSAQSWGSYYAHDPQVCAGVIVEGKAAIDAFLSRRRQGGRA